MIDFSSQNGFELENQAIVSNWLESTIKGYDFTLGDLSYLFCDDDYLHSINVEFLKHDNLTDIITFDYSYGKTLAAELLISTDRVKENAATFNATFTQELHRVMIHGVLHCLGLNDKSEDEQLAMRSAEDLALQVLEKQIVKY